MEPGIQHSTTHSPKSKDNTDYGWNQDWRCSPAACLPSMGLVNAQYLGSGSWGAEERSSPQNFTFYFHLSLLKGRFLKKDHTLNSLFQKGYLPSDTIHTCLSDFVLNCQSMQSRFPIIQTSPLLPSPHCSALHTICRRLHQNEMVERSILSTTYSQSFQQCLAFGAQ